MDKRPADDPRILEALEACRPGSDDLSDPAMELLAARMAGSPELDGLYERLQRLDKVLADAYQDVPVPEGLADRILARLRESPMGETLGTPLEEAPIDVPQPAPRLRAGGRLRRRTWMVGAGILGGVAAALLIAALVGIHPQQQPGWEEVCNAAIERFNQDLLAGGGKLAPAAQPDYPLSGFLSTQDLQVRWRPIRDFFQYEGVAYDLIGPGGVTATLYVVDDDGKISVEGAPPTDPYNSGDRSSAAWRENGLLYVLVVAGQVKDYRRFIAPASEAWT